MIKASLPTVLLCAAAISACQSNSTTSPKIDIIPESNIAGETSSNQLNGANESSDSTLSDTSTEPAAEPAADLAETPSDAITIDRPQKTGNLENTQLTEVSGMAASTRQSNTFWAINDSGNNATLFAFDTTGADLGNWKVNSNNRDWEDMASAWVNGESYLFIADIGDNLRVKNEHSVHVIAEPIIGDNTDGPLEPLHTIRFRYPDAPHNAESLAVNDQWIYVLTKEPLVDGERQQSRVYRIPLVLSGPSQIVDAELIAQLAIPDSSFEASIIASLAGVDVSQPTAFDIDKQNRNAYVLTYRSVYRYHREEGQSWADALSQPRDRVHSHSLSQAEALAIGEDGLVWFTSEKRPAPLWALPRGLP